MWAVSPPVMETRDRAGGVWRDASGVAHTIPGGRRFSHASLARPTAGSMWGSDFAVLMPRTTVARADVCVEPQHGGAGL